MITSGRILAEDFPSIWQTLLMIYILLEGLQQSTQLSMGISEIISSDLFSVLLDFPPLKAVSYDGITKP